MRTFAIAALLLVPLYAITSVSADTQKTVWQGAFSDAQADRGGVVYKKECTLCHSDNFKGNIDGGPPLVGKDFEMRWDGLTMLDIVNQVSQLMPGDEPGSVSRKDWVDLFAYLFRANGATMGPTDLPSDDESLAQVHGTNKPGK
jgi:hypothetical protein